MENFDDITTTQGDIIVKQTEYSTIYATEEYVRMQIEAGGTTDSWREYIAKWKDEERI